MKPHAHWPEYFRTYGRREPAADPQSQESQGQGHTPFSFAWGHPELPPWEVKALYPSYASAFAKSMKSRQVVGGDTPVAGPGALCDLSWVGVEARKVGEGSAVVVDVGGGLGQLLKDVLRDVEGIRPGQCVLQDRKEVIEEARTGDPGALEGVVMMEHDFHEEQPVKGKYCCPTPGRDFAVEVVANLFRSVGLFSAPDSARLLGSARHSNSTVLGRCSAC